LRVLPRLRINTNIDCRIKAILDFAPDKRDLHDWVVATLLAHIEERILGVGGLFLGVGVVGRRLLDLAQEALLDVELADMGNCAALDGVVG